jgi:hypothetical protein
MISSIIKTEALIILDIIRKPNSIIVLFFFQKLKRKQTHFVYILSSKSDALFTTWLVIKTPKLN